MKEFFCFFKLDIIIFYEPDCIATMMLSLRRTLVTLPILFNKISQLRT